MAAIGGFRSDLSITRKTDGNFANVSAGVVFSKVAYQRKRWLSFVWLQTELDSTQSYYHYKLCFVFAYYFYTVNFKRFIISDIVSFCTGTLGQMEFTSTYKILYIQSCFHTMIYNPLPPFPLPPAIPPPPHPTDIRSLFRQPRKYFSYRILHLS